MGSLIITNVSLRLEDVDNVGGYEHAGTECISETSVHATQFDCEPKTALKDQVYYIYSKEKSVSECMLNERCC